MSIFPDSGSSSGSSGLGGYIYKGTIRHRRFSPTKHEFTYQIRMLYLNLSQTSTLFRPFPILSDSLPSLGWFRRKDYVGSPDTDLQKSILDSVEGELGFRPDGDVYVLTHLRYWGLVMNPIAIFYCYNKQGNLVACALQVTNTPWKEKILYVLEMSQSGDPSPGKHFNRFWKEMHVSPFNPMAMEYHCRLTTPNERLFFHLENHDKQVDTSHVTEQMKHTDATLILNRRPLTRKALWRIVLLQPYDTAKVLVGIYWNALKLWFKGTPIFDHQPVTKNTNR